MVLLSGGVDSAALAAWRRPDVALFVDYGQRPRQAELRAAQAVARELDVRFDSVRVDLAALGSGLLHDDDLHHDPSHNPAQPGVAGEARRPADGAGWPSPEWWPFRNQLLVSFAAAWAVKRVPGVVTGEHTVTVETGTVSTDGSRHVDGTSTFYRVLDDLLRLQEGSVRVLAPALEMSTTELIEISSVSEAVLGWTHSCHRGDIPCGECPGCYKRAQLLSIAGRFHGFDAQ